MDNKYLKLFDEIIHLYEFKLALIELKNLNINYSLLPGEEELYKFKLEKTSTEDIINFIKRTAFFKNICGISSDYYKITRVNSKNLLSLYGVHPFYPYKGKFHPQMIRGIINILKLKEGDIILDPFSGSGTLGIEASYLGIKSINYDIFPLCILLGKVKARSFYIIKEVEEVAPSVVSYITSFGDKFISYKDFHNYLCSISSNEDIINFFLVVRLLSLSDNKRRNRVFTNSFIKNINLMINILKELDLVFKKLSIRIIEPEFHLGDARELASIEGSSISAIITSPPYATALDYIKNDLHSIEDMGYSTDNIKENFIGIRGKSEKEKNKLYFQDMEIVYNEMIRVLRPGGDIVLILGNTKVSDNIKFTIDYFNKLGIKNYLNIEKKIQRDFTIKKEHILFFKKT